MTTVQDILNELSQFDPNTEVVFTSFMEQGRGSTSSNGNNTSMDIDTIDNQEELDEAFYFNTECGDIEDEETPTFTKQIVHISMSGEESNYE